MDHNALHLQGAAYSLNVIHKGAAKLQHAVRQYDDDKWEEYFPNHFIYAFFAFNSLYNIDWYTSYNTGRLQSIPKIVTTDKGSQKIFDESEIKKQRQYISFCFQDNRFVQLYKDFFIGFVTKENTKEEIKEILSDIKRDSNANGAIRTEGYVKNFQTAVENILSRGAFNQSNIKTILHYIYSVRCNFFHGVKSIKDMLDYGQQDRLYIYASFIIAMNQMVFSYLDYLIKGEKFTESFDRLYNELM